MIKVPKKDFEIFKKECLRLQKAWGLTGWELHFEFLSLLKEDEAARCSADLSAHMATLTLSSELPDHCKRHPTKEAKHEMLHLLLWRMDMYGYNRFMTENQLKEAEHEVIQQLMKIIP